MTVRPPTYPERQMAWRFYPSGWWVSSKEYPPGRVISCTTQTVTVALPGGVASVDIKDVVSCTWRQAQALDERRAE